MKLTDKRYNNQVFKNTSFCNGGVAVWWTKKKFNDCQFLNCDFNDVVIRGCLFKDCVFKSGKMQHTLLGCWTLVMLRKSVYIGCTFERVKLRSLGIADFIGCTFINCDFNTAFIAASFSKCKFIGMVHGCVFCGPKYDSYYYGDKLSYWVSNKGRLNDVDFSEAILTDVDFRVGIDLSTVLFPASHLSCKLINKYSLETIGVHGFAYPQKEALKIANGYFNSNIPILGGDVYKLLNGHIESTSDSWYCNRNGSETPYEYIVRSYHVTLSYIREYPGNENTFFSIVIEQIEDEI